MAIGGPLAKKMSIVVVLALISILSTVRAGVIAKSSKQECVKEGDVMNGDKVCKSKLVVALTVTANEGKAQTIHASISRTIDETQKQPKAIDLKNPIRITVIKSPVLITFRLFQVGVVPNYAREEVVNKRPGPQKLFDCQSKWYASPTDNSCGFALTDDNERIFGSQGFCCLEDPKVGRGASQSFKSFKDTEDENFYKTLEEKKKNNNKIKVAHCMREDHIRYFVMGVYPPRIQFNVSVILEERKYRTLNNSGVWKEIERLEIGPQKRIVSSASHTIRAEYLADFYPATFLNLGLTIMHRYVLVPDSSTTRYESVKSYPDISNKEWSDFMKSIKDPSEWMAIEKPKFGTDCDEIGVSYPAFKNQPNRCSRRYGSCLHNQPFVLWREEKKKGETHFQINYIADRPMTSIITLTMAADDIKIYTKTSKGRIISAFIDTFEALSTTGLLQVIIQNIGSFTAAYQVFVRDCSAGIDLVPAKALTLNPFQTGSMTFIIHSFHSIGKINECFMGLYDANNKELDNMTVTFETTDTCFCYGYCGCACGYNKTNCPKTPEREKSHLKEYQYSWLERALRSVQDFARFIGKNGGAFLTIFWIALILLGLGVLKVIHIVMTGNVDIKIIRLPIFKAVGIIKYVIDYIWTELCPQYCDSFFSSIYRCFGSITRSSCFVLTLGEVNKEPPPKSYIGKGWRPPPHCDGMCKGAKFRRKIHRKEMRMNKRVGIKAKKETPWFEKPYNCTCKVKDTMPCTKICQGLWFFFYCPFLPLWWLVTFFYTFLRRKWRRRKRINKFRQQKAIKEAKKAADYVHLDKYSRGQEESEIVKLDRDIKKLKQQEKEFKAKLTGLDPDLALEETSDKEGRNISSETDTSDPEQAEDVEELVKVGHPVYFNYAVPNVSHSLKNPGESYTIKGKLTVEEIGNNKIYYFSLHVYTYQIKQIVNKKAVQLKPPVLLQNEDFKHRFEGDKQVMTLVTLVPLFKCLNGTKDGKRKKEKRKGTKAKGTKDSGAKAKGTKSSGAKAKGTKDSGAKGKDKQKKTPKTKKK